MITILKLSVYNVPGGLGIALLEEDEK